jgi:hypothetical protein
LEQHPAQAPRLAALAGRLLRPGQIGQLTAGRAAAVSTRV